MEPLLHIVFGQSSVANLQAAFELDEQLTGEIRYFEEDFSVGPLFILDTPEGKENREQWWLQVQGIMQQEENHDGQIVKPDPVKDLKNTLKEQPELQVWIWLGQNATDVSGYFWLIGQLEAFAGRIHIIFLNNLPFLNEKGGVFYPTHLHQVLPKEFLKAKKLARPVSLAEFELDNDEWHRLMNENAGIRMLEGGKKLKGEPATFFDKEIMQLVQNDFVKASKVINQLVGKLKFPITDIFLNWRMKELVKEGQLEHKGELKSMRDYDVKKAGNNNTTVEAQ
ncbi:hypothetical protein COR50_16055 [Chitinophaga caeni]|uniref:DUF1835 domain-containing protein n=1 Tax=Chitinophaga caeni TaxID=2029983 RepID=A0A291QXG0_9BACT|nr:DUF1835 domain-containing protein [Chitinophaga caeni]ATL48553.1 hypothetical protein COR50_16055 [Chitinophaga caeni]